MIEVQFVHMEIDIEIMYEYLIWIKKSEKVGKVASFYVNKCGVNNVTVSVFSEVYSAWVTFSYD